MTEEIETAALQHRAERELKRWLATLPSGVAATIPAEKLKQEAPKSLLKVRALSEQGGGVIHGGDQGAPKKQGRKGTIYSEWEGRPFVTLDLNCETPLGPPTWQSTVLNAAMSISLHDLNLQVCHATLAERFEARLVRSVVWAQCAEDWGAPPCFPPEVIRYASCRYGYASGGGHKDDRALQPELISMISRQGMQRRLKKAPDSFQADLSELVEEDAIHGPPWVERWIGFKEDILAEFREADLRKWVDQKSKTVQDDSLPAVELEDGSQKLTLLSSRSPKQKLTAAERAEVSNIRREIEKLDLGLFESRHEADGDLDTRASRSGFFEVFGADERWNAFAARLDRSGRQESAQMLPIRPMPNKPHPTSVSASAQSVATAKSVHAESRLPAEQVRAPNQCPGLATSVQVKSKVKDEPRLPRDQSERANVGAHALGPAKVRRAPARTLHAPEPLHADEDRSGIAGAGVDAATCEDSA